MAHLLAHISIDQLGYRRASIRDVVQLATGLNREAALIILGIYNLSLSLASVRTATLGTLADRYEAQRALFRLSLSETRLTEIKAHFGDAQLLRVPLFHRQQLLTLIKLVAKFGRGAGGNRLQKRDDFNVLGELALLTNSLWTISSNDEDAGDRIAPDLAVSFEVENPPSIAESMMLAASVLGTHLDSIKIHDAFARRLEQTFVFSTGLNFQELLDLTFAVWSYYSSMPVTALIEDQRKAHFNPLNPDNIIAGRHLRRILDTQAIVFGEVPGVQFGNADSVRFRYNHTPLRMKPFWKFGDDNYLCIDPAFLQEKLSSGVYWTIMNALDPEDGNHFARLWGRLFERQLWMILESIYASDRVWRSPRYLDNGDEAFDAVLDYGSHLVVCQAKSTFVPVDAKYSGNSEVFFEGMESRYGDEPHAVLRQVRENLVSCFGLAGRRVVEQIRGRKFREVIPIVVYQEPILEFGLVSRRFTTRFERELKDLLFVLDLHVRPVVFIHISDFHLIAQYIRDGDFSLVDLLHSKLSDDPNHVLSLGEFFKERFRKSLPPSSKRDSAVTTFWQQYSDEALGRFRAGLYK